MVHWNQIKVSGKIELSYSFRSKLLEIRDKRQKKTQRNHYKTSAIHQTLKLTSLFQYGRDKFYFSDGNYL